eukprot:scaffold5650_cov125-Skeletonema_menzelii.AAC.1
MTSISSDPPTDGQAAAAAAAAGPDSSSNSNSDDSASSKKGGALRQRSDDTKTKKRKNNQRNNQNGKPKRRRRSKPRQRAPHIMPEARDLVQDLSSGYAYIWDSESDDDDDYKPCYSCGCCTNMQESIKNHTRLYTPRTHPDFFVRVHRSGSIDIDEDDFLP